MDSREDLHQFWRQERPDGNNPHGYVRYTCRSEMLGSLLVGEDHSSRVLEVGCNVGRNLAYLADNGWNKVEGIEISETAVRILRETYPQLKDSPIHQGPAESILPTLNGQFDIIFTMAVIEHIHPDSSAIFDEMASKGRSILCFEPMANSTHRQYPHDVEDIFTSRGMKLVDHRSVAELGFVPIFDALSEYFYWRFELP